MGLRTFTDGHNPTAHGGSCPIRGPSTGPTTFLALKVLRATTTVSSSRYNRRPASLTFCGGEARSPVSAVCKITRAKIGRTYGLLSSTTTAATSLVSRGLTAEDATRSRYAYASSSGATVHCACCQTTSSNRPSAQVLVTESGKVLSATFGHYAINWGGACPTSTDLLA